jgi:hypothetical protein
MVLYFFSARCWRCLFKETNDDATFFNSLEA